ncbi:AAA family ATPase [Dactylosporangium sp. NPDC051541]|uniref:AAA family ATPase n=1 Tax=Dactylosporangium sp. NPDC051541 TaxID=3363977 RepID=UPI003791F915
MSARPTLILLCGLPGSGKTTLARRLATEVPAVRLCADEWLTDLGVDLFDTSTRVRLERRFWRLAQDLLRQGQSVVMESGFWLRADRDEKRAAARALGAAVELRYLDVPLDELARRLEARNAAAPWATAAITRELLELHAPLFEPPDADELEQFDPPDGDALSQFESPGADEREQSDPPGADEREQSDPPGADEREQSDPPGADEREQSDPSTC